MVYLKKTYIKHEFYRLIPKKCAIEIEWTDIKYWRKVVDGSTDPSLIFTNLVCASYEDVHLVQFEKFKFTFCWIK